MRGTDGANTTTPDNTGIANILTDTSTTLPALINAVPDATLAAGAIDGFTLEETQKILMAAMAGKVSGGGTTNMVFRAADDSKARVTATVDSNGNRTVITLDAV